MTSLCQGLRRSAGSGGEDPENQVEQIPGHFWVKPDILYNGIKTQKDFRRTPRYSQWRHRWKIFNVILAGKKTEKCI